MSLGKGLALSQAHPSNQQGRAEFGCEETFEAVIQFLRSTGTDQRPIFRRHGEMRVMPLGQGWLPAQAGSPIFREAIDGHDPGIVHQRMNTYADE
jgi:hypothetical protein